MSSSDINICYVVFSLCFSCLKHHSTASATKSYSVCKYQINMNNKMFIVFVTVLLLGVLFAEGCDMDQTRHGCRIQNKGCSCGFGCKSEYRYPTMKDCLDALKGKRTDMCFSNPCLNGGSCIQISQRPGYRCRCEGTGFYGLRCHQMCPLPGMRTRDGAPFPYECIVI